MQMKSVARAVVIAASLTLGGVFGVAAEEGGKIPFVEKLTIKVGQSAVIHGIRGDCGQLPPASKLKPKKLKTGTLTYGKTGIRNSRSCGGPTPAVEVIFTATKPGKERFKVEGDSMQVIVTE